MPMLPHERNYYKMTYRIPMHFGDHITRIRCNVVVVVCYCVYVCVLCVYVCGDVCVYVH